MTQRVHEVLNEAFELTSTTATISVSVGTAYTDHPHASTDDLLAEADAAMYAHKRGPQPPQPPLPRRRRRPSSRAGEAG